MTAAPQDEPARRIPELFASSFARERSGDLQRATNDVLQVVRLAPGHYIANLRAGWLLYRSARFEDSERLYRRALELRPRAVEPRVGLLLPLMGTGQWGRRSGSPARP